ncbi:MAG: transcriptional regulator [candidate division NC10 bacterium]|nr:transcriptional regulator [candidate division NC10 bacterium]
MLDDVDARVQADFARARSKAFLHDVWALLSGKRNTLLSYDHVKEKLRIGGPLYRGVRTVEVGRIVGSVNRYRDFDGAFLPAHNRIADRWQRVDRAFYEDVSLPPVVLYKVGEVYFVVDGHHRVSVAREQGQEFIEAEVRECKVKVPVGPDLRPEDLEILGAKVEFLHRTGLDRLRLGADIDVTVPDGFPRMLEHIAVHRYFMGLDEQRDIPEEEAVTHWYDTVYLPIVTVIRERGVLEEFPGRTEGDVYLWVLDHQHFLADHGKELSPPEEAAEKFVQRVEQSPQLGEL